MPKNTVTDPITDQEIAFAHLVLSGTMTDRCAAEAVGLNPETAAYTKAKPRVRSKQESQNSALDIARKSTTIWLWIDWIQHLRLCLIQPGGR